VLDGPFYRLQVSPVSGGLVSLLDKTRGRELVDPRSDYHLNQAVYLSEGLEHTAQAAQVELAVQGPVFAQLVVQASLKHIRLTTTFTLYHQLDRVDILNQVTKLPTAERHELSFVFPFQVPDRQYRFEAPGVIVTPGAEQRPGAGQAVTAVRHFVDVFNSDFGVTLSQADSGLVQFGHRTSTEDPLEPEPGNSTVWALALGNNINWREVTRDQAGGTDFTFRYSLRGHAGGFDPVSAVQFGWEDNNELLTVPLARGQQGNLPPHRHSFVKVEPDHVILTSLKVAEEEGLLLRLWECAGQSTVATVTVSGLGALAARQTDLLEKDIAALSLTDERVSVPLKARDLASIRLLLA
jgi:alpha-mannosidase